MDLRKLNPAQLQQLIEKATRRREELTTRRLDKVRARIDAILKAEGLTLAEVYGPGAGARDGGKRKRAKSAAGSAAKTAKRGSAVPPKYRNPDNPAQTWAGRGLKPRWMVEALAAGRTLEELLIR